MFVQYQNDGIVLNRNPYLQSDYVVMTELAPKWSPFHVLCDLHIVGDTPYRFG